MRLKRLKTTTKVKINNEGEYLLLMQLAEKAGYIWAGSLTEPTYFNDTKEYRCQSKTITLSSTPPMMTTAVGTITRTPMCSISLEETVPLKKVIKFEVGDKVRLREGIIKKLRKEKSLPTETLISEMKKHINKEDIIEDSFSLNSKKYYYLKGYKGISFPKKWLDPILPSVPKEETAAGKEE